MSNILFLVSTVSTSWAVIWITRLRLVRVFRIKYIRSAVEQIVTKCGARLPIIGKTIDKTLTILIEILFWLHIMTCTWIYLGQQDCYDEVWLSKTPDESTSWMFIAKTDFSKDPRTIYEQVVDDDSPMSLSSLYIYALYWVLTVLSTVGYGHATYNASAELIYACFLEVLATITQAYTILSFANLLTIKEYSFEHLMFVRMNDADYWLVSKIETVIGKLPHTFTE